MTVGELKIALEGVDESMLLIVAKDAEGNGFSPLYEIEFDHYKATSPHAGEIGTCPQDPVAVYLWPTN